MQFRSFLGAAFASLLVSCGGGGDDATTADASAAQPKVVFRAAPVATAAVTGTQTQIVVASDPGEFVGDGGSYSYTQANAVIQVAVTNGVLNLRINGDENWTVNFALPGGRQKFSLGTYDNVGRYPFHDPAVGGMDWTGEGRGCNQLVGAFRVNSSQYVGTELVAVDIDFVQHCEGLAPALYGNIRWFANDTTVPPGPQRNVPDRLWSPAPESTPATGSFVYLESDAADFVGDGKRYTYTPRNSHLKVTESGGLIQVAVNGNEFWSAEFKAMNVVNRVRPGWYRDVQRYPFHNPAKGGLAWGGDGRGCNQLVGWFAVDEIAFVNGALATLDMRFEQRCQDLPNWTGPLHGRIRWDINDRSEPLGPRRVPDRLWAPRPDATPATGNYVYLDSPTGEYVGGGVEQTFTTSIGASASQRTLKVTGGGYTGTFVAMDSIPRIKRGYYPGVQRWPFHNPALGGMDWSGNGRGCNELAGWFAIDDIRYDALGLLMELDMRFSQRCDIIRQPLFGAVHWVRPAPALRRLGQPTE